MWLEQLHHTQSYLDIYTCTLHLYVHINHHTYVSTQWAFGVTVWELFTCGSVPYSGIPAMSVLKAIKAGQRLEKPENLACSNEMLVAKEFNQCVKDFCSKLIAIA